MAVEHYLPEWQGTWDASGHDPEIFFAALLTSGRISRELYDVEIRALGIEPPPAEVEVTPPLPIGEVTVRKELMQVIRDYLRAAYHETLVSLWQWMLEKLRELIDLVTGFLKPILQEAWELAKSKFEDVGRTLYDGILKAFEGHSPLRPEEAPALALRLYLFAMGMGMAAHGAATVTELLHPLKQVGLHQTAAILGDFGGFSRISGATIGVLENRILGQAMTYCVQDRFRPMQPDERLLQIMAVKPDITIEQFRKGMAYLGYSDPWIDAVQRTMYHEPRYFELKMMSEDQAASEDWLFTKSRRAGFTEADSRIMVSSYLKTATRTQRLDYYRQGFYLYKEGYIDKEAYSKILDELEIRPEAKSFCMRAAELAYLNDYIKDMLSYYIDSFMKDIIDDEELLVSLVGLGITSERAWLLTAKAKVRKKPKPSKPVTKAAESATAKMQSEYITLYVTQYRKDLIDETELLESLLSIGLANDLAEVTVAIEAAKKGLHLVP